MVPILGLLLGFTQHRAQGTSLVALIPPTGLLAVLAYEKAGYVDWRVGLLLIPGVFLGGITGGNIARRIPSVPMRKIFAALMFLLGVYQVYSSVRGQRPRGAMVDLHCHILSGMDDGARSFDESLAMAEMAIADGITHVVATPHASPEFRFDYANVKREAEKLQA